MPAKVRDYGRRDTMPSRATASSFSCSILMSISSIKSERRRIISSEVITTGIVGMVGAMLAKLDG